MTTALLTGDTLNIKRMGSSLPLNQRACVVARRGKDYTLLWPFCSIP